MHPLRRSNRLLLAVAVSAAGLLTAPTAAQDPGAYRLPPAPIPQILDAQPTPLVLTGRDGRTVALLTRENLPSVAELAEPELRLAGTRINPNTSAPPASRIAYSTGITFQDLETGAQRTATVPQGARIAYAQWSPDGSRLAFASATTGGMELWVAEVGSGRATRVLGPELNAAFGSPFTWLPDGSGFLVARVPADRGPAPARAAAPTGPIIQESLGRTAAARTYQDLLETPHDEALFEHYFTSQLTRVPLSGRPVPIDEPGIYRSYSASPDGRYILATRLRRPFSYVVPLWLFADETVVLDARGNRVHTVHENPVLDDLPTAFDAVAQGPRGVQWRPDAPATLAWAEAQDGGDPRQEAEIRDRVYLLDAPFTGAPRALIDLEHRYAGIWWGRDDLALVLSRWWNTRWERRYAVNPSDPSRAPRLLFDRSYQDRYADPGSPVFTTNAAGRPVLMFTPDGASIYLSGGGASPRGSYPFLDRMDVRTAETTRLWQAEDPYYETVVTVLAEDGSRILTRRESVTEAPNFFVRTLPGGQARAVTDFPDPAPQLAGIQRQLVTYPRADGVQLSATLFTPPGYDAARDGPLPMLMWAYPQEFRDAAAASQVTDSPNRFSRPGGSSHLFLLTQGYAILDNPAMPVVGEGDVEPNETFVEQLVSSAQAAVDKVVEMGVARRDRIGIGGHSYGAFMTANLLAHSDLFRAGIARSGAYNRTLTPFGFQAEQRSYWEATELYTRMSPFTYANRVNEPILLIHGENDENSGTFPIQSERYYAALRGHGATVRYVVLPLEGHGYRARESVMHALAEMVDWMDRWVKNAD
jgi:dipeptidyl aminopeptidase/acylaminoacyl peptidase